MSVHDVRHEGYLLSDDPSKLDLAAIKAYLKRSYWASERPDSVIEASFKEGIAVGAYAPDGTHAGAIRVITDFATFAWLCDVHVVEEHRGKGLSKALLAYVHGHPKLITVARFLLATRDAHSLYAQLGYTPLVRPQAFMEKRTAAFVPIRMSDSPR